MNSAPLRCTRCEATLSEGARFCASCGAPAVSPAATEFAHTDPIASLPRADDPLPLMRLAPGTLLSGVYTIQSVLGEGGMGVVYRAHDASRDRTIALKCLHTNLAGDVGIRRRFVREARVLRSFSHPHVVTVYDFIEQGHLLGIVMEHVEGPNLARHLARWRGRMPLREVREVFACVLDAVEAAHRAGIVHRDLKPENVLIAQSPGRIDPKIVDFGIARILEGTTYTVSGALLGTCRYMSPEQVKRPEAVDHRSDIYSLGVTLYELVTGKAPFEGGNHFALMMSHVSETPKPPSRDRPDVPAALERLILDALAKDPADRPATCAEFRERLLDAIEEHPALTASTVSTSSPPPVLRDTDGVELVLIPAGEFQLGSARREVYLDAYYIDRTPVTNLQFKTFVDVTDYRPPEPDAARFLSHWSRGNIPRGLEHHPVTFVAWDDACAYAAWAGKRLPTEAEWEKAARGTDGRKYPFGQNRTRGARPHGTCAVGASPEEASPYGVLDVAGNVWEWCDDIDDPEFYKDGPPINPRNTARPPKPLRVVRGGSWMYDPRSLRTYTRASYEPHYRLADVGFRCARSVR
jgi:serine/threonine-protein kinase